MRIKTLEMSGFKSFADRTVINFESGTTGIVGPNGSGKSNIVDAIRWVMGEMSAKHLRGSAMEDVIFNGSESRSSTGMAHVFLTFDNSDGRAPAEYAEYSEIQVGRRLYRSGESEYFINKTPCRLKDIIDLFLGTGVGSRAYSVIEQGMIGNITSTKPEERRLFIEEAAGISKFKSRKDAALRKMDATRQNLARLSDILSEMTHQMNSLNRQAKKAERYKRISEELKERDLTLSATKYRLLRTTFDELKEQLSVLNETEVLISAELSNFEGKTEEKRLELVDLEHDLDSTSQRLYRTRNIIKLNESEIKHREDEKLSIFQRNESFVQELSEFRVNLKKISEKISSVISMACNADFKLAGAEGALSVFDEGIVSIRDDYAKYQRTCEMLAASIMECDKDTANLTAAVDHIERRHIEISARIAKNQAEIDGIDERVLSIKPSFSEKENLINAIKSGKYSLKGDLDSLNSELDERTTALAESEKIAKSLQSEFTEKSSKLSSLMELRRNLEGYRDGVKAIMTRSQDSEDSNGILGTVSDLFETSSEYEGALGAVLGEKLQYIVVKSHKDGVEAIDYLRSAVSGRSAFIPVGIRTEDTESEVPQEEGVIGAMSDFVRFDDDYKSICQHLIGDVVLVENLGKALSLWETGECKRTFVTKDGCVVESSGIVTGGASGGVEEHLIAQKRRIKELENDVFILKSRLEEADVNVSRLKTSIAEIGARSSEMERRLHDEELKLIGQERDLQRLGDELNRYESERDKLSVETAALTEELSELIMERDGKKELLETRKLEHAQYEGDLSKARISLEEVGRTLKEKEDGLLALKIDLAQAEERASLMSRELNALVKTKIDTLTAIRRRFSDINKNNYRMVILNREIQRFKDGLDHFINLVSDIESEHNLLREKYDAFSEEIRQGDVNVRKIRKKHDEALAAFHEAELNFTEHKGRMDYLAEGVMERYRIDIASIESKYADDELDVGFEEREVITLKEKIEKMGSVNVDAIDEYREISERYEFLSKQNEDLLSSLENLSKAITKINRTSKQRFIRAFDAVNEQFKIVFPKLFNGGMARLVLTDEENILESGVEIIVQPPGKKLQSITLLSGGEKALAAVALIFSIFLTKPSPFCLLDEVDAPLDDANIDRVNELIRAMTEHSQFILITHNKRSMELADVLYGVTMDEPGVSKIISVSLNRDNGKQPQVA